MRKLLLLLTNSLMLTLLILGTVRCQTYQVRPFELGYVKPYSGDCHFKDVVTKKTRDIKAGQCDLRRMLLIPIESARIVLDDIQINCHLQQCTMIRGAGDSILLTIDQGLQKVPF